MDHLIEVVTARVVTVVPLLQLGITRAATAAGLTVVGVGQPARMMLSADGVAYDDRGPAAEVDVRVGPAWVSATFRCPVGPPILDRLGDLVTQFLGQ